MLKADALTLFFLMMVFEASGKADSTVRKSQNNKVHPSEIRR
jgi:hypothetical protein